MGIASLKEALYCRIVVLNYKINNFNKKYEENCTTCPCSVCIGHELVNITMHKFPYTQKKNEAVALVLTVCS